MPTENKTEQDPADLVPGWVEFTKIVDKRHGDAVAKSFFGDMAATEDDFNRMFNVNLENYRGMFIETNVVDAPVGNIYQTKLTILVLQRSSSGKTFTPHLIKHDGFVNPEMHRAWVEAKEWEECVQDNLNEELTELAKKEIKRQKLIQAHMEKLIAGQTDAGEKTE